MKQLVTILTLAFLLAYSDSPEIGDSSQFNAELLFTGDMGVQMYSFRNIIPEIGMEAMLDKIKEMGITEIEGGGGGGLTLEEFREMCEVRGLKIVSTGTGFDNLAENSEAVANRANTLGAKYVMNAWITHQGDFDYEDAKNAVDVFNKAGKVLHEHGLTFKYHPHGFELRPHEDGTLLDYIIQNTNPDYVSFQLDVFWIHFGGGDPIDYMLRYPDRIVSLHLKDMQHGVEKNFTGLTDNEYNVVLGIGELDMEGIIRTALEIGVEHFFIEDESSRVMDQIPQSIAYLRSLKR